MLPSPEPKNADVVRARSLGASVAEDTPPRDIATASISSMKPIAPPSLRAAFRSFLKNARIRQAVIPCHMDTNDGAGMNMNGTPACFAIALARKVFPVPGGPSKRMPRRGVPPSSSRKVAYPRKTSRVRITSSTCVSRPLISVSPISTCSGYTVRCGERPNMKGISAMKAIATKMPITGKK